MKNRLPRKQKKKLLGRRTSLAKFIIYATMINKINIVNIFTPNRPFPIEFLTNNLNK